MAPIFCLEQFQRQKEHDRGYLVCLMLGHLRNLEVFAYPMVPRVKDTTITKLVQGRRNDFLRPTQVYDSVHSRAQIKASSSCVTQYIEGEQKKVHKPKS